MKPLRNAARVDDAARGASDSKFEDNRMTRDQIFDAVKANVLKVLPDLNPQSIVVSASLTELGANSVDRVEVAMYAMESLQLKIPLIELHGVRNLADLVELFFARLSAK